MTASPGMSEKAKDLRQQALQADEENAFEWLQTLSSGDLPIRVTLVRKYPKTHQGVPCEGVVETYEEPLTESDIRETHGGGTYTLRIATPDKEGVWKYLTARTIKISGPPKVDGIRMSSGSVGGTSGGEEVGVGAPSVVREAMKMQQSFVDRMQKRAEKLEDETVGRGDPTSQLLLKGMQAQMEQLQRNLQEKDSQLMSIMSGGGNRSNDVLLEKLLDGDNSRISAMRTQLDSELRMKDQMHRDEVTRMHERYEDQLRRSDDAHKREIDQMQRSYDSQISTLKLSYEGQMQGFAREIAHLDRELTAAKAEVAELRAKKDKSIVETMTEIATVKDALDSFGGGNEKPEGGTLERVINGIMGSSLAEGIASRIAQGPEASKPAAPALPELPVDQPTRLPDGRVVMRRADGSLVQIRKRRPAPPPAPGAVLPVDEAQIPVAVEFLENALRNDTDPETFAIAARNLVPASIIEALKVQGVDAFLANVAKIPATSPLMTQHGKNWVRKVAAVLTSDVT